MALSKEVIMLLENITMDDFKKGLKKTKTLIIPFGRAWKPLAFIN